MDHLEAIVEIKKIIPEKFTKQIINLINKKNKKYLPVKKGLDRDFRNVEGYHLSYNKKTDIKHFDYIKEEIEKLYTFYKAKFPLMHSNKINQIDLLKYSVGGKYDIHSDHGPDTPRHLSIIMNLNDNYEGGDLIFTDQKFKVIKRLKLGKGTIVFFPSNFMYPHSIEPITKGIRYSIVAWLQ